MCVFEGVGGKRKDSFDGCTASKYLNVISLARKHSQQEGHQQGFSCHSLFTVSALMETVTHGTGRPKLFI